MKIRAFAETDLDQVMEISKCSFSLTPFHVDDFFSKQQADNIVWEQWTRPAVDQGKNHCFVADLSDEIAGFIIYGGYKPLHEAIGKKVASIILLAVKEKFRNSIYKTGSRLVEYALEFFKKNGVFLVTVGTDLPNFAALHVYEKNGFRRVLQWSTYRYYDNIKDEGVSAGIAEQVTERPHHGHEIYFHPISFLQEKAFSENEYERIRKVYDSSVDDGIRSGSLTCLHFKNTSSHAVLEKEKTLSEQTGKRVYRLNRIISPEREVLPMVLSDILEYLHSTDPGFMLECFVASGKTAVIEALTSLSFRNVHTTVTLHNTLERV